MSIKITADSSCDLTALGGIEFAYAPLKIIAGEREFTDCAELDTEQMLSFLENYSGKSSTSCPNVADWEVAFGEADEIFAVTITSNLSGSYNAARLAREEHLKKKSGRVGTGLSRGHAVPAMKLILDMIGRVGFFGFALFAGQR